MKWVTYGRQLAHIVFMDSWCNLLLFWQRRNINRCTINIKKIYTSTKVRTTHSIASSNAYIPKSNHICDNSVPRRHLSPWLQLYHFASKSSINIDTPKTLKIKIKVKKKSVPFLMEVHLFSTSLFPLVMTSKSIDMWKRDSRNLDWRNMAWDFA